MITKLVSFLFSPITRLAGWVMAAIAVIGFIYGKGRRDARNKIEGDSNADALRRTQNAIRAGDAVDTRPDRLRENDGHRRD
ncbi:MAG: hypothetical protein AMJ56_17370 [Anaerolineae bacterium SG8_19]|jgi:hypothetical protein|nr:MAG: hypothetical protein AMJ56_17370 [Anaerolineae bacterium SG8_19]